MPELDMDEPLLSPSRIARAIGWWVWFYTHPTLDHSNQIQLSVWHLIRTYRRSYANRHLY